MARSPAETEGDPRPALRLLTGGLAEAQPEPHAEPSAVAVILSDGSVRPVGAADAEGPEERWASGTLQGDRWTLWWERRLYGQR